MPGGFIIRVEAIYATHHKQSVNVKRRAFARLLFFPNFSDTVNYVYLVSTYVLYLSKTYDTTKIGNVK